MSVWVILAYLLIFLILNFCNFLVYQILGPRQSKLLNRDRHFCKLLKSDKNAMRAAKLWQLLQMSQWHYYNCLQRYLISHMHQKVVYDDCYLQAVSSFYSVQYEIDASSFFHGMGGTYSWITSSNNNMERNIWHYQPYRQVFLWASHAPLHPWDFILS